MLTIMMVFIGTILEAMYETVRDYIKAMAFKHKCEKMRPGHRVNVKTRIVYGLESVWDYLITPR